MFGGGLRELVEAVRDVSGSFDARLLSGEDAALACRLWTEIERMAVGCRMDACRRVEQTKAYKSSGCVDAASWAAQVGGVAKAEAATELATARRLESLPQTSAALRSGSLSPTAATHIARVADPHNESALLEVASTQGAAVLQKECNKVAAVSAAEERRRHEARRARRLCKVRNCEDGNVSVYAVLLPDEGARFRALFDRETNLVAREATKSGQLRPWQQYQADAFMALVDRSGTTKADNKPSTTVHVVVDHDALMRGYREPGEASEVIGVGQVPISQIRSLLGECYLSSVVMKGHDVVAVTSPTKYVPQPVRQALFHRDKYCVVPGCESTENLEIHHIWRSSQGGPSQLDNLVRLCKWHHRMETHQGWRILGSPGQWRWVHCPDGVPAELEAQLKREAGEVVGGSGASADVAGAARGDDVSGADREIGDLEFEQCGRNEKGPAPPSLFDP